MNSEQCLEIRQEHTYKSKSQFLDESETPSPLTPVNRLIRFSVEFYATTIYALRPVCKSPFQTFSYCMQPVWPRNYSKRVTDIPNVGFYSLPQKMGRTGRFINDGLRLISLGCKQKQKKHKHCKNPTLVLSQSVTSPRPPTASQWAAVRITTEACRHSNPLEVIPVVQVPFFGETEEDVVKELLR